MGSLEAQLEPRVGTLQRRLGASLLLAATLFGCVGVEHHPADLQLDLEGELPLEVERVRICVADVGVREFPVRERGSYSVTGLFAGESVRVTVDALDEDGALVVRGELDELEGYGSAPLGSCDTSDCEVCRAEGGFATEGEETWVLAVRFVG